MAPSKAAENEAKSFDPNYKITNNNAIDVHVGRRVRLRRTLLEHAFVFWHSSAYFNKTKKHK